MVDTRARILSNRFVRADFRVSTFQRELRR